MSGIQGHPAMQDSQQVVGRYLAVSNADATLGANEQVVDVASDTSAVTITLPVVSDVPGKTFFINAPNGGTNTVTVQDNDESFDWKGDYSLDAADDQIALQSDGRKWWVVTPTL